MLDVVLIALMLVLVAIMFCNVILIKRVKALEKWCDSLTGAFHAAAHVDEYV